MRGFLSCVVGVCLFAPFAQAQQTLPDEPKLVRPARVQAGATPVPVKPTPESRRPRRKHHPFRHVADKNFWLLFAVHSLASVYDIESSQHCIHTTPGCRELNPLVGNRRPRAYAVTFALQLFTQDIPTYYLKRQDDEARENVKAGVKGAKMPPGGRWWFWGNVWTATKLAGGSYNLSRSRR